MRTPSRHLLRLDAEWAAGLALLAMLGASTWLSDLHARAPATDPDAVTISRRQGPGRPTIEVRRGGELVAELQRPEDGWDYAAADRLLTETEGL